jgi:hypothetical protein
MNWPIYLGIKAGGSYSAFIVDNLASTKEFGMECRLLIKQEVYKICDIMWNDIKIIYLVLIYH